MDLELEEEMVVCGSVAAAVAIYRRRKKQQEKERRRQEEERERLARRRRFWVRPWLLRRPALGQYETLMGELAAEDHDGFISFQRVCPEIFRELLEKVAPLIKRQDTKMRLALDPGLRLAITLRFLATGEFCVTL
jgi:hypothetical protein